MITTSHHADEKQEILRRRFFLCFISLFSQDYNNHRQEIFSKMATLMEELFIGQLSTVSNTPGTVLR